MRSCLLDFLTRYRSLRRARLLKRQSAFGHFGIKSKCSFFAKIFPVASDQEELSVADICVLLLKVGAQTGISFSALIQSELYFGLWSDVRTEPKAKTVARWALIPTLAAKTAAKVGHL